MCISAIPGARLLWALLSVAWPGLALAAYGAMGDDRTLLVAGAGMAAIFGLPAVVYAALGTFLGELVVALEGEAPMRALRRSFALAHGNRMTLLWFSLVCAVVQMLSLAGLLLCCVGVLATLPFAVSITEFAKTEAFLLYTRGTKAAEDVQSAWNKQSEYFKDAVSQQTSIGVQATEGVATGTLTQSSQGSQE